MTTVRYGRPPASGDCPHCGWTLHNQHNPDPSGRTFDVVTFCKRGCVEYRETY